MSTGRGYETTLALFMGFVTDRRYGWPRECAERFGLVPQQIFHEDNRVAHVTGYEGRPGRRPLAYDEVQALFDAVDGRVERARGLGRKGALTAMRDAALLKTVYAFGLRRNEARMLDLPDLRRAPKAPQDREYGGVFVRFGKASNGSPPKRRTVLTVPEMDWIVDVLGRWVTEVRPLLSPGSLPALFITGCSSRMSLRGLNTAFGQARVAAGLPPEADLHALRHSYVTHLVEFDYPEKFVSLQVGHAYASTTAICTGVPDEYRNRLLQRVLQERLDDVLGGKVAALASRAVERDYIDVAAALARGYGVAQLTGLAVALDGLAAEDFADVGQRLDRLGDDRFARYGLTPEDVTRLREQFSAWPRTPGAVPGVPSGGADPAQGFPPGPEHPA